MSVIFIIHLEKFFYIQFLLWGLTSNTDVCPTYFLCSLHLLLVWTDQSCPTSTVLSVQYIIILSISDSGIVVFYNMPCTGIYLSYLRNFNSRP
jgi:hypothetical protein